MKPKLTTLAILLISATHVWGTAPAAEAGDDASFEAVIVDRQSLQREQTAGQDGRPAMHAAEYLLQAGSVGAAAEQVLADERAGELDAAHVVEVLAALRDYQGLSGYARAKFIADALWTGWSIDRYNQFWLDQAARLLQDADYAGMELALRHLRKPWSAEAGKRRYSLWGQLYLRQGQYADAVVALDKQAVMAGDGLFDHYNFGLALLHTGKRDRALSLLDEIGYSTLETQDHRMLRDRVNLMLGWHWLRSDQGGTAREYFKRVSLDGPDSNRALLGLGWAELAADGTQQIARYKRRVLCEKPEVPPDALMRLLSDRYAPCRPGEISGLVDITHSFAFDPAARGAERYQEALRPWQVLAGRASHDPAVQEALLAAGYALQKRQADVEAMQAYRAAITRYEEESTRLAKLELALQMPQTDVLALTTQQALAGEFAGLRSRHDFASLAALQPQLRDLQQLLQALGTGIKGHEGKDSVDAAGLAQLRARLAALREASHAISKAQDEALRALLLADLSQRRQRLDQYHARARIALAQMFDRSARPEPGTP